MYSLLESSVRQTKIDKFKIIMKKVSSLTLNSYPIISLLRPAILVKKDIHNTGPIDISHEHALKRVYMQHLSNGMDQHCNFAIRSIAKNRTTKKRARGTKSHTYIYIASTNVPQRNKRLVLGRLKSGAHEERGGVTRRQSG